MNIIQFTNSHENQKVVLSIVNPSYMGASYGMQSFYFDVISDNGDFAHCFFNHEDNSIIVDTGYPFELSCIVEDEYIKVICSNYYHGIRVLAERTPGLQPCSNTDASVTEIGEPCTHGRVNLTVAKIGSIVSTNSSIFRYKNGVVFLDVEVDVTSTGNNMDILRINDKYLPEKDIYVPITYLKNTTFISGQGFIRVRSDGFIKLYLSTEVGACKVMAHTSWAIV